MPSISLSFFVSPFSESMTHQMNPTPKIDAPMNGSQQEVFLVILSKFGLKKTRRLAIDGDCGRWNRRPSRSRRIRRSSSKENGDEEDCQDVKSLILKSVWPRCDKSHEHLPNVKKQSAVFIDKLI